MYVVAAGIGCTQHRAGCGDICAHRGSHGCAVAAPALNTAKCRQKILFRFILATSQRQVRTKRPVYLYMRNSIDSGPHHVLPRAYCGCISRWKMASSSDAWWILAQNCTLTVPCLLSISCPYRAPSALQPTSPSQLLRAEFVCCNLCCGKVAIAN